jgi:branched-chain amino acid transport system ATP-binding protein
MKEIMLRIEKLNAFYGGIQALHDVEIHVPKGKVVSIIGANGAGKSTLLKSVSGLIRKKTGNIFFKDNNITRMQANRIVPCGISQVPEGRQLFSHLSVKDNIRLGAYWYYTSRNHSEISQRVQTVYEMFPILEKRSNQLAGTLSGGEQQMLAISRAFMSKPELLLLDEPSMGIAPLIVKEIFHVIQKMNESGVTVLLVEQNAKAALNISQYGYVLESGKVALEGLPGELLDNPRVKEVYLGG